MQRSSNTGLTALTQQATVSAGGLVEELGSTILTPNSLLPAISHNTEALGKGCSHPARLCSLVQGTQGQLLVDFSEAGSQGAQFALTPGALLGNRLVPPSLICTVMGIKPRFYACLANTVN